MKSERSIFLAFILNISFSIFELIGGIFTYSMSIISDSIHDMEDALSIGVSYFLERKSKKKPDNKYTYGYVRYSILGSILTTLILLIGSIFVIYKSVLRIINPVEINYDGMLIFAIVGVIVNLLAMYFTKEGKTLNEKTINLHMLEDVLGWIVVLIGSIIMKFTNLVIIDSIMSILVGLFIFIHALKNLLNIIDLFLEKVPNNISIDELKSNLLKIDNVYDVHHIHIWSLDGVNNCATMHIVINGDSTKIKEKVRKKLKEYGISHITIEIENKDDICLESMCKVNNEKVNKHHH